jgi:multiple sugar transport system substrate-binding protein
MSSSAYNYRYGSRHSATTEPFLTAACAPTIPRAPAPHTKLPYIRDIRDPIATVRINYWGAAISEARVRCIIAAFERQHPTIRIAYHSVPVHIYDQVLESQFTQGGVDLYDVDQGRTASYAARGWEADLSKLFADKLHLIEPAAVKESAIGGKLMNLPYQSGTTCLYFNKNVLRQIEVDLPSTEPGDFPTWEWVERAARKAVQAKAASYGITFSKPAAYSTLYPLAVSLGGGNGMAGDRRLAPDVNNPAWVRALSFYGKLYASGLAPRDTQQTALAFAYGQSAFFLGGVWDAAMISTNRALDFGITSAPRFQCGQPATMSGGWALGISAISSAEKQRAAAIFLDWYLFSEDGGFVAADAEADNVPTTEATQARFWARQVYADPRLEGMKAIHSYQTRSVAQGRPKCMGAAELDQVMTRAIGDIVEGADPKTVLDAANSALQLVLRRYDETDDSFMEKGRRR